MILLKGKMSCSKAPAKQAISTTTTNKQSKHEISENTKQHNFESENSPGKENRINIKLEEKKDDAVKIEKVQESKENIKKENITKDPKQEANNRLPARSEKKRQNSSKKNENQAKRRKRIQVSNNKYCECALTYNSWGYILKLILRVSLIAHDSNLILSS